MTAPTCIECGKTAWLTDGEEIYPHRRDLWAKRFWKCECGAYCGCHPRSTAPLGFPCGPETRKARSAAHAAFDPIWQRKIMGRSEAYRWLSEKTGIPAKQCHIGMMTREHAELVAKVCQQFHAERATS